MPNSQPGAQLAQTVPYKGIFSTPAPPPGVAPGSRSFPHQECQKLQQARPWSQMLGRSLQPPDALSHLQTPTTEGPLRAAATSRTSEAGVGVGGSGTILLRPPTAPRTKSRGQLDGTLTSSRNTRLHFPAWLWLRRCMGVCGVCPGDDTSGGSWPLKLCRRVGEKAVTESARLGRGAISSYLIGL